MVKAFLNIATKDQLHETENSSEDEEGEAPGERHKDNEDFDEPTPLEEACATLLEQDRTAKRDALEQATSKEIRAKQMQILADRFDYNSAAKDGVEPEVEAINKLDGENGGDVDAPFSATQLLSFPPNFFRGSGHLAGNSEGVGNAAALTTPLPTSRPASALSGGTTTTVKQQQIEAETRNTEAMTDFMAVMKKKIGDGASKEEPTEHDKMTSYEKRLDAMEKLIEKARKKLEKATRNKRENPKKYKSIKSQLKLLEKAEKKLLELMAKTGELDVSEASESDSDSD